MLFQYQNNELKPELLADCDVKDWYELGKGEKDHEKCIQYYTEHIKHCPDHHLGYIYRGIEYLLLGEYELA